MGGFEGLCTKRVFWILGSTDRHLIQLFHPGSNAQSDGLGRLPDPPSLRVIVARASRANSLVNPADGCVMTDVIAARAARLRARTFIRQWRAAQCSARADVEQQRWVLMQLIDRTWIPLLNVTKRHDYQADAALASG